MRAVSSIKRRIRVDTDGNVTRYIELRLWDKPAALRMLGQHVGMFKETVKLVVDSGVLVVPAAVGSKLWEQAAHAQQRALQGAERG